MKLPSRTVVLSQGQTERKGARVEHLEHTRAVPFRPRQVPLLQ